MNKRTKNETSTRDARMVKTYCTIKKDAIANNDSVTAIHANVMIAFFASWPKGQLEAILEGGN